VDKELANRIADPVRIGVATGMRRQEIVGLNWDDIDIFQKRRITIRKSKTDRITGDWLKSQSRSTD
jgi:integrase